MTPATEVQRRLDALGETLRAQGLDGAVLVHATDVLYLAGTRQNAALWVPARGEAVLLVRKSLERARAESPLADVRPFPSSKELAAALGAPRRVGFTFDVAPGAVERFWARALGAELADVSAALRLQRSVKSPWELARMRETAALLCGVYRELPSFLRPGMREVDLAAEIEYRMRKAGNEGSPRLRGFNQEFFMGLALSAGSATAPSYFDGPVTGRGLSPSSPLGASLEPIPRDAPILLDYTAMKAGYVTDLTRIAVCGRLAPEVARAFEVALAIQAEVVRGLVPGAIPSELWARAKALAEREGLGDRFMGPPGAQARFVGHGVGLELDELPVLAPGLDAPLVAGQALAVEPKFVLPGLGAIGIENTWAVAEGGGERITELPDEVVAL
ncbi:MAG TPA: Xaa-Pro peptidase family protein [Anaeromyxobacteraceae bacterium]|jgi:Xaa-Pro aminopeptidase|nr:Xaa-Pro peptidase family protein [Anaeromyxobacteraceae bacterium]